MQTNCVAFDRESGELKQILTALTIVKNDNQKASKDPATTAVIMSSQKYVSFLSKSLDMTDGKLGFRQYGHLRQLFGLKDLILLMMMMMMMMMMMWMRVMLVATRHVATIISHNGDGKQHSY